MLTKTSLLATAVVLAASGAAHAGGQAGSLGVGAEAQLSGLGGASVAYDAGKFHLGAFLGYDRENITNNMNTRAESVFEIGGRLYFHLHSTAMADFGLGGGISIASVPAGTNRDTLLYLEPGFQIRLFLASNVALSFTGGLALGVVDADSVAITGQVIGGNGFTVNGLPVGLVGGAGIHYYFF